MSRTLENSRSVPSAVRVNYIIGDATSSRCVLSIEL
jgi:hypothetical protein